MRVKFLPHKGSGFSYRFIAPEELVLAEVLKTYLYGLIVVPVLAAGPSILGFTGIWNALGFQKSLQIPYIIISVIWAIIIIWKTADWQDERCRAPE